MKSRRPRVLYLAFFFPPSRASGVFRPLASANFLAEQGWDVTVHAGPREYFTDFLGSVDPELEARIDPRITVVRPPMPMHTATPDIRDLGVVAAHLPTVHRKLQRLRQQRGFPEVYRTWIPGVLRAALREHVSSRFDLVVATGNPFASFAAAWAFSRLTRVPYVLDYRDAWTFHQFLDEDRYPTGHSAWTWERRVLSRASEIEFVNAAMLEFHAGRYPQARARMTVVPNGFEPEVVSGLTAPPHPERPLRFVYLGTVTETMPIEELMAAWAVARRDPRMRDATLTIHGHLGFRPWNVAPLLGRISDGQEGVRYAGPVSKTEVGSVYADADVLLLWLPGGRYVTSGKVFEYMATGLPIVSVHDGDNASREVLAGYPCWVPSRGTAPDDIAAQLLAGAEAARSAGRDVRERGREHAMQYTRPAILAPWERRMRRLARG